MKIWHGTTRTALCVANFAIKFPRYSLLWKAFKKNVVRAFKGQWGQIRFSNGMIHVINGMVGNLTEYVQWLYSDASAALTPVYFSIGLFSVQKYIPGETPSWQELHTALDRLPEKARQQMEEVSKHHWVAENFRQTGQGLIMIDYGDMVLDGKLSLGSWLVRWEAKLAEALTLEVYEKS